jgi:hypothetical protein
VFGKTNIQFGFLDCDEDYTTIVVHLEWNMIFFAGEERTINAYDMDRKKVHVIPALVIWYGRCRVMIEDMSRLYYLSYVPLFLESLGEP